MKAQHIHILGIAGTFMGSIAKLAIELGFEVSGSDQNIYPPMSTQLENLNIDLISGYDYKISDLPKKPDLILIGNVISRGNKVLEDILNNNYLFTSGPNWLRENILVNKKVICVAGTHGKTTTSSMLTWMLESLGLNPGYLIGGVPGNFEYSARLTDSDYFIIEADEYDSAFFDKRAKFVHYFPQLCVLNNLEYDHADIYPNLEAIITQFRHLVKIIPNNGNIIINTDCPNLPKVLEAGCFSKDHYFSLNNIIEHNLSYSEFLVKLDNYQNIEINWDLYGKHNALNALAAICAVLQIDTITKLKNYPKSIAQALASFKLPKRRLEKRGQVNNLIIYEDFAHHPTAIKLTLEALKAKYNKELVLVLDLASNSMQSGAHQAKLADAIKLADNTIIYQNPKIKFDLQACIHNNSGTKIIPELSEILTQLGKYREDNKVIVFMSNGSFGGVINNYLKNF